MYNKRYSLLSLRIDNEVLIIRKYDNVKGYVIVIYKLNPLIFMHKIIML